jgi:hypothetical protein
MKKSFLAFFVAAVFGLAGVYADEINIRDYFPLRIGSTWAYGVTPNKINETRTVKSSVPNPNGDGTTCYWIETFTTSSISGNRSESELFTIKNNRVINIGRIYKGGYENYSPNSVRLAPPGYEERERSGNLNVYTRASKGSCRVNGRVYSDCIVMEVRYDTGLISKYYYAKGIGFVLETIQVNGLTDETELSMLINSSL